MKHRAQVKYSVVITHHKTSISIEPSFLAVLKDEAMARHISMNSLLKMIDDGRGGARDLRNRSCAVREWILATVLARNGGAGPVANNNGLVEMPCDVEGK